MSKVIGILGGLGPQTTAKFYLKLVELCTNIVRPAIAIWSLPLNVEKEREYIHYGKNKDHYIALLKEGVMVLQRAGSDFIVIPCNTVHEFYEELASSALVPIVNLIDVVANEAKSRKWNRVLLLATSETTRTRLYQGPLEERGIAIVLPNSQDQEAIDSLIQRVLDGKEDKDGDSQLLKDIMACSKCNNVVLGCTDLQAVFPSSASCIDSMEAFARHTVALL